MNHKKELLWGLRVKRKEQVVSGCACGLSHVYANTDLEPCLLSLPQHVASGGLNNNYLHYFAGSVYYNYSTIYIYPNPILIIKAPIVGFRVEGLSVVHGGHQSKLFGFTVWRLTTSPALTSVC